MVKAKAGSALMAILTLLVGTNAWASVVKTETAPSEPAFKWETQSISQTLSATDKSAEAWFLLTNPGPNTRQIVAIKSDCDCITTAMDRRKIYPGESAALIATFHPNTEVGSVFKKIQVISKGKEEDQQSDTLVWELQIQSPVRIEQIDPTHSGLLLNYRIESTITPPPILKVPKDLSERLHLEKAESDKQWLLKIDASGPAQTADSTPLYLIALLPDGLRKHIPVPTPSK